MKISTMKKQLISLSCLALFLQACASSQPKASQPADPLQAPVIVDAPVEVGTVAPGAEVYGPPVPPADAAAAVPVAPPPTSQEPKICVALGPGMAKALAEASVLDALVKAGLPIHCVVGSEMGAVVGALFAKANGSANTLAWELFKFNKDNYFNFPLFSLRAARSTGNKLHEVLDNIFRGGQIESLPLQFATVATDPTSGAVVPLRSGSLSDALSATLALPEIFQPWKLNDRDLVSGAMSSPLALDMATALGADFIIAVSVMDDVGSAGAGADHRFEHAFAPVRNLLRLQKKEVKEIIQVHLPNIPYDDFSKQAEIFSIGKTIGEKEAARIKQDWDAYLARAGTSPAPANPSTPAEHL
jgi:NTE family protein